MLLCSQCTTRILSGSHTWRIPAVIHPSHPAITPRGSSAQPIPAGHLLPVALLVPVGHPLPSLPAHLPHSPVLSLPRAPGAHPGPPVLPLPTLPVYIPHSRSCPDPNRSRRPGAGQAPRRAHLAARSAALRSAPPLSSARGPPAAGGGGAAPARPPPDLFPAPIPGAPNALRVSLGGGTRGQGMEPTLSTGAHPQEFPGVGVAHPFAPRFAKL